MSTPSRLTPWQQLLVFLLVAAAIVSRRPDALFHPQFYAEDGSIWFADAWNLGHGLNWWRPLLIPGGGYLNTFPRLVCTLALLLPLTGVPLFLNLVGIAVQALPVNVLLSARCANWGAFPFRLLQAAVYVMLPNSSEINVTITNAHWHLALLACLIAFATPPTNAAWRSFDIVILLLTGLTGPWSFVLIPLLLIHHRQLVHRWQRQQPWPLVSAALLSLCSAVQAYFLLTHPARPTTPLGASFLLLLKLVAGNIFLASVWGENSFARSGSLPLAIALAAVGLLVLGYGLACLRVELKLFIAFAILITAAALNSPLISGPMPRWLLLAGDRGACAPSALSAAPSWSAASYTTGNTGPTLTCTCSNNYGSSKPRRRARMATSASTRPTAACFCAAASHTLPNPSVHLTPQST